jgi:hypothetical protein
MYFAGTKTIKMKENYVHYGKVHFGNGSARFYIATRWLCHRPEYPIPWLALPLLRFYW